MRVAIVGGGKVGYFLTKLLAERGRYHITVIEQQPELCRKVAEEFSNVTVIEGDGTSLDTLSDAKVHKCDFFIAVTGKDEDNLISCQLAKKVFEVKRTIARANNPKNINVMKRLGVDNVISSTDIIAKIIEHEVEIEPLSVLATLKNGEIIVFQAVVQQNSPAANKKIADVPFPKESIIGAIMRENETFVPSGDSIILPGDTLLVIVSERAKREFKRLISSK
ncbi:TrkA-N domain protein [Caldicellulosiruptor hydrothermalis 108]|uniref:Trk system potassium uptake protein TrkA n=1 Tax=Caldicellulosiruptor hydrothermalis (strain DSM 18901 / VKM B-2411 / 108) TaxID=632292 RepID=E4Q8T4_CALH1|nr:NAD-binding protein [Caldicellulosiruptor hydrothermalis]ADQ08058.1 TrkA-N domain protein [Caldicellulosiruptor hydrothermalis 108]